MVLGTDSDVPVAELNMVPDGHMKDDSHLESALLKLVPTGQNGIGDTLDLELLPESGLLVVDLLVLGAASA